MELTNGFTEVCAMEIPLSLWMYICFAVCLIGFTWMMVQGFYEVPPISRVQEQGDDAADSQA